MKISVRVKPNARKDEVKKLEEGKYLVSVNAPPVRGKANGKVIEVLAEYFGKPKPSIRIIRGLASRDKIIDIL